MTTKMKKKMSIIVPFEVMKENIKQGEKWVRTDWKVIDKYVIIADERYKGNDFFNFDNPFCKSEV